MGMHRQLSQDTRTSIRTSANPSRVRVGRIKQRLQDEGLFSTSNIELVTQPSY